MEKMNIAEVYKYLDKMHEVFVYQHSTIDNSDASDFKNLIPAYPSIVRYKADSNLWVIDKDTFIENISVTDFSWDSTLPALDVEYQQSFIAGIEQSKSLVNSVLEKSNDVVSFRKELCKSYDEVVTSGRFDLSDGTDKGVIDMYRVIGYIKVYNHALLITSVSDVPRANHPMQVFN